MTASQFATRSLLWAKQKSTTIFHSIKSKFISNWTIDRNKKFIIVCLIIWVLIALSGFIFYKYSIYKFYQNGVSAARTLADEPDYVLDINTERLESIAKGITKNQSVAYVAVSDNDKTVNIREPDQNLNGQFDNIDTGKFIKIIKKVNIIEFAISGTEQFVIFETDIEYGQKIIGNVTVVMTTTRLQTILRYYLLICLGITPVIVFILIILVYSVDHFKVKSITKIKRRDRKKYRKICMGCMEDKGDQPICVHCGFNHIETKTHPIYLPPRTYLRDSKYIVGKLLGKGGFGITYIGFDINLDRKVAIKEYLPTDLASRNRPNLTVVPYGGAKKKLFARGLNQFIREARNVAQFAVNNNIVNIHSCFEENNTGYMIMDYLNGGSLSDLLNIRKGKIPLDEAIMILKPILIALTEVHSKNMYHLDISPQNILFNMITADEKTPLLIDFGAAKRVVGKESRSLDAIGKHGYAPLEQYSSEGDIGPWTDVYACGATLYCMITGDKPPSATDRIENDGLIPPSEIEGIGISTDLNDAILCSLAVKKDDRFQTVEEFHDALVL